MKVVSCNQRNGGHRKARSPTGPCSVSAGLRRRSCGLFPDLGPFCFLRSRVKEILTQSCCLFGGCVRHSLRLVGVVQQGTYRTAPLSSRQRFLQHLLSPSRVSLALGKDRA